MKNSVSGRRFRRPEHVIGKRQVLLKKEKDIMMNPMQLMKLAGLGRKFRSSHPKVVAFFQKMVASGIPDGTILEMTIRKPGEEPVTTNMRVTPEDLELLRELKNLNG